MGRGVAFVQTTYHAIARWLIAMEIQRALFFCVEVFVVRGGLVELRLGLGAEVEFVVELRQCGRLKSQVKTWGLFLRPQLSRIPNRNNAACCCEAAV